MNHLLILLCLLIATYTASVRAETQECQQYIKYLDGLSLTEDEKKQAYNRDKLASSFIWENDAFTSSGDRHYTNGMKYAMFDNPCNKSSPSWSNDIKNGLAKILDLPSNSFSHTENDVLSLITSGYTMGMNMYTPNDIKTTVRNTNDRPFAGYLYYGLQAQILNKEKTSDRVTVGLWETMSAHNFEVQAGVIGPSAMQEFAQRAVHIILDARKPRGWDNQLEDRLALNANYMYRRNLFLNRDYDDPNDLYWRLTGHAGANVGSFMNFVNTGFIVSFGRPDDNYPSTTIQPTLIEAVPESKPIRKCALYFFVGVDYRYIANSIFIEGDGAAAHDIELVNDVHDVISGVTWVNAARDFKFTYKVIERSEEFKSSDPSLAAAHKIGQFSFDWLF